MSRTAVKSGWLTALLAGGIFLVWTGLQLRYYTRTGPGPGFLPVWIGGLLVLATLAEAFRTLRGDRPEGPFLPSADAAMRVGLLLLALLSAWFLLGIAGFRLTILAFALVVPLILGRQPLVVTGLVAVVLSFGVAFAFERWLGVRLPGSSVPFLAGLGL